MPLTKTCACAPCARAKTRVVQEYRTVIVRRIYSDVKHCVPNPFHFDNNNTSVAQRFIKLIRGSTRLEIKTRRVHTVIFSCFVVGTFCLRIHVGIGVRNVFITAHSVYINRYSMKCVYTYTRTTARYTCFGIPRRRTPASHPCTPRAV